MPDWTDDDIAYFDDDEAPGLSAGAAPPEMDSTDFVGVNRGAMGFGPKTIPIPEGGDAWSVLPPGSFEKASELAQGYADTSGGGDIDRQKFMDSYATMRLGALGNQPYGNENQFLSKASEQARAQGFKRRLDEAKGLAVPNKPVGLSVGTRAGGQAVRLDDEGHAEGYWNGRLDR